MAALCRLAGRRLTPFAPQLIKYQCAPSIMQLVRPVTLKVTKPPEPCKLNHDHKNLELKRPQSPHISIYKLQLTSFLSFLHRMTGMTLSIYMVSLASAAVFLPQPLECYIEAIEQAQLGAPVIYLFKTLIALPFCYHYVNGCRHLSWDTGKGLGLKSLYASGYLMVATVLGLTAFVVTL